MAVKDWILKGLEQISLFGSYHPRPYHGFEADKEMFEKDWERMTNGKRDGSGKQNDEEEIGRIG